MSWPLAIFVGVIIVILACGLLGRWELERQERKFRAGLDEHRRRP